jgi:hypothetical protein
MGQLGTTCWLGVVRQVRSSSASLSKFVVIVVVVVFAKIVKTVS